MVGSDAPSTLEVVVSIVTYRSNLTQLTQAIDSLKGQSDACHIMLVDNDSPPDYRAQLDVFAGEVELVHAPRNGGFGYGHNLALLRAPDSRYMLVLNPDAVLHQGALRAMIDFMEARPEVGMVAPKVFYPDGRLQPLNKRLPNVLDLALRLLAPPALTRLSPIARRLERYSMMDVGYDAPCPLPFASGCCLLLRRDVMRRVGGFDEGFFLYFEDADLTMRVNEIAQTWFCPQATITHAWQRGSRSSLKLLWIMVKSAARYFAKWGLKLW